MYLRQLFVAVLSGWISLAVHAQAASQDFSACEANFPGDSQEARDKRYACFTEANKPPAVPGYHLDRLWPTPGDNSGIVAYKQNYLLFVTHTDTPNLNPTSPNLKNQVTPSYYYEKQEAKFQFSLKSQVPHFGVLGESNSLWLGFTQQSNWQIKNGANSRPFRESNYEPELIFSHQFEKKPADTQWAPRILNFGFVHQSNGQALPASRSWNRVYMQLGMEKRLNDSNSLALLIRPWVRCPVEEAALDDNPDIYDYLGHGDLELLYWNDRNLFSALIRSRSVQVDLSWSREKKSLHWHLQLFTGYGESLIDYNQQHSMAGFGVSLPYN
jgi:phospholipase A1